MAEATQPDLPPGFRETEIGPLPAEWSGEHAKTTLPSLQKPDLESHLIPVPPLPEQRAIASVLAAVDRKIEAEEQRKRVLEALFKRLLHHLMTGRLRVKERAEASSAAR